MRTTSTQSGHNLDSTWPEFLDLLDTDPQRALDGLHVFTWKVLEARPPAIMRSLGAADREDRIADLVLSCCVDDFHRLRKYRDIGKPFAAWLITIFVHQVLSWLRSQRPVDELTEAIGAAEPHLPSPLSNQVIECVNRCLGKMSDKCRLYLACLADGMKPKEIALLLRLPDGDNKRVSDDLRHCTRKLREMLLAEGVDPEQVLP